mmetsp:Transcript_122103/g.352961  ORF Transcript_122103/g.352961 Transcript_122103/m.352961 type:complete len:312 (-) Transcript_122103:10-945(-)
MGSGKPLGAEPPGGVLACRGEEHAEEHRDRQRHDARRPPASMANEAADHGRCHSAAEVAHGVAQGAREATTSGAEKVHQADDVQTPSHTLHRTEQRVGQVEDCPHVRTVGSPNLGMGEHRDDEQTDPPPEHTRRLAAATVRQQAPCEVAQRLHDTEVDEVVGLVPLCLISQQTLGKEHQPERQADQEGNAQVQHDMPDVRPEALPLVVRLLAAIVATAGRLGGVVVRLGAVAIRTVPCCSRLHVEIRNLPPPPPLRRAATTPTASPWRTQRAPRRRPKSPGTPLWAVARQAPSAHKGAADMAVAWWPPPTA